MKSYDETIERLKAVSGNYGAHDINVAFMGSEIWYPSELRDALVKLLETARDSVPMPVDRNGEVIRVGDKVEWNDATFEVRRVLVHLLYDDAVEYHAVLDSQYEYHVHPDALTHHHEPTVDEILDELEGMRGGGADYEAVVTRCADLARTLRELLEKDDA